MGQGMSSSRVGGRSCAAALAAALTAAGTLTGCLVDQGRCGPHQDRNAVGNCVCAWGYIPDDSLVCRKCGENQVSQANSCTCAPGFSRNAAQECVAQVTGVGDRCANDADCTTGAPHCEVGGDAPYCTTTGCTASEMCPGGFGCDTKQSPSVCVAPPKGLGDACTSQEDCAGQEASYCELTSSKVCLVSGCTVNADCWANWTCCDLTAFGLPTLCVAEGACPVE